jgi:hypothetical protein
MSLTSDGSGFFSATTTGFPNTNAAVSISGWYNIPSLPGGNQGYVNIVSVANSSAIQIGNRGSAVVAWRYGGNVLVTLSSNPSLGVLHHIVYTTNGTLHNFYLDGEFKNSNSTTNISGVPDSYQLFGNQYVENSSVTIDDIRVYNRELSPGEISAIYTTRSRDKIFYGLVARHRLNEGAPGTHPSATGIKDISQNMNHGVSFTSSTSTNYTYKESLLRYRQNFRTL